MPTNDLVKEFERLSEKKRKADLAVAAAQSSVEAAEKAAAVVRKKVAEFGKSPKELRDWADSEETELKNELEALEGGSDEVASDDVDI
jgi:predicted  nucleic acid-binding Zn-ribbon protein